MSTSNTRRWEWLEQMSPAFFLSAAGLFLINAIIILSGITGGSERLVMLLGETFNAAAWALALVGLLGIYPSVADRNRWLSRIGAICSTIGIIVFTALSMLSLAFYLEIVEGSIQTLVPLILPGVLVGGILSFLLLGIVTLRTEVHPRVIGILLLLPPLIVVVNIASGVVGLGSQYLLLGIVSGLFVVALAIGVRLRSYKTPINA